MKVPACKPILAGVFLAVFSLAPVAADSPNSAELSQAGEELSADITQELPGNRAEVVQAGLGNVISLTQRAGAVASTSQTGANNRAVISQDAAFAASTFLELSQNGNGNQAHVTQEDGDNTADLLQVGDDNVFELLQVGGGNMIVHHQVGDTLGIRITQLGGANIVVTQSGAGQ